MPLAQCLYPPTIELNLYAKFLFMTHNKMHTHTHPSISSKHLIIFSLVFHYFRSLSVPLLYQTYPHPSRDYYLFLREVILRRLYTTPKHRVFTRLLHHSFKPTPSNLIITNTASPSSAQHPVLTIDSDQFFLIFCYL